MSSSNPLAPPASSTSIPGTDGYKAPLTFEQIVAAENAELGGGDAPRSALCISGGGIRSATFALGALQALADLEILQNFDYLSTVSGGGYIGSWLTAWKKRLNGTKNVIPKLKSSAPFPPPGDPDPVQHLREYNNYLSPKLGFFSTDTWTLVATVARNMFLNWLVLVPLLLFALMIPRLVLSVAALGDTWKSYGPWLVAVREFLRFGFPIASGLLFAIGLFNALRYLPGVGGQNRSQGHFLKYVLTPLIGAALAFMSMEGWFTGGDVTGPTDLTFLKLFAGITLSGVVAWIAYLLVFFRKVSSKPVSIVVLSVALLFMSICTSAATWLLVRKVFQHLSWALYITVSPPLLMLAFAFPVVLFVGLTSHVLNDEDREWLSRAGAWWLLFILCWAGISALVLQGPTWLLALHTWARSTFAGAGGAAALFTVVRSLKSKAGPQPKDQGEQPPITAKLLDLTVKLAAAVFIICFLISLALLTNLLLLKVGQTIVKFTAPVGVAMTQDWWDHGSLAESTPPELVLLFMLLFFTVAWLMARCININKFSLHAMYRDRLIRAYLGASNEKPEINKFTGFDESDNLRMSEIPPGLKPFHVVNITLNLVAGKRLAWQQRKAESFTASALYCGSSNLGYRPSAAYGGKSGISLGTAMSLSGAAASPNMGYYSSPVFGFIMTLLNARLGAWLGNPGSAGSSTWRKQGPSSAVDSLVREAFGLTDENCPYVYLSDGGHFENLGIYEMVKRRCRYILVLDGAADGELQFGDLGNALRKIRIDTKVDIKFQEGWAQALRDREKRWAVATVCYQDAGLGPDGYLIYAKPLMCGNEPPDVTAYQAVNPDFPHQSTADQFFNESQTESYRMLGLHTITEMCAGWNASQGFAALVDHARNQRVRRVAVAVAAAAGKQP